MRKTQARPIEIKSDATVYYTAMGVITVTSVRPIILYIISLNTSVAVALLIGLRCTIGGYYGRS
jgi:hypothetical protein